MTLSIPLPVHPADELRWEGPRELAFTAGDQKITWELDLGRYLEDELSTQAICLALSFFSREFYPHFAAQTEAISLYRGTANFASLFSWNERQQEKWELWKKERPASREKHLKRLFCADMWVFYFQRFAQHLPDEVPLLFQLNAEGCGTRAEKEQLLSKERFHPFTLEVDGLTSIPHACLAFYFPEEAICSSAVLEKIDFLFEKIPLPFRIIQEPFLTEEWEGVDRFIVLSEALSPRGKRKLIGFCAGGGEVVVEGPPLGFPTEISFKDFLRDNRQLGQRPPPITHKF